MDIVTLEGYALQVLLEHFANHGNQVYKVRFQQRADGIAVKINEAMWSPTLGKVDNVR